jgi:hypothetical protein
VYREVKLEDLTRDHEGPGRNQGPLVYVIQVGCRSLETGWLVVISYDEIPELNFSKEASHPNLLPPVLGHEGIAYLLLRQLTLTQFWLACFGNMC